MVPIEVEDFSTKNLEFAMAKAGIASAASIGHWSDTSAGGGERWKSRSHEDFLMFHPAKLREMIQFDGKKWLFVFADGLVGWTNQVD